MMNIYLANWELVEILPTYIVNLIWKVFFIGLNLSKFEEIMCIVGQYLFMGLCSLLAIKNVQNEDVPCVHAFS